MLLLITETKVKQSGYEKWFWKDQNTEYLSGIVCSYKITYSRGIKMHLKNLMP